MIALPHRPRARTPYHRPPAPTKQLLTSAILAGKLPAEVLRWSADGACKLYLVERDGALLVQAEFPL